MEAGKMKATMHNQAGREHAKFRVAGWLTGVALAATTITCGASPEDLASSAIATEKSALEVNSPAAKAEHISATPTRATGKSESGLLTANRVAHYCGTRCPPPSAPINFYCSPSCGECGWGWVVNAVACEFPETPPMPPRPGPVVGQVEGFTGNIFHGWACDKHVERPIDVHFYLDAPAGASGAIGPLVVNASGLRETAVGSACGTSSLTHGWTVDVTPYKAAYAGRTIYVYGISASGGSNLELRESGAFTIPL